MVRDDIELLVKTPPLSNVGLYVFPLIGERFKIRSLGCPSAVKPVTYEAGHVTCIPVLVQGHVPFKAKPAAKVTTGRRVSKKKEREKIFPVSEGKCVLLWLRGPMRNLAFPAAASLLLPVQHPLGRDLAIGVLRQVYKSHSGFFHSICTCGWLVTCWSCCSLLVL